MDSTESATEGAGEEGRLTDFWEKRSASTHVHRGGKERKGRELNVFNVYSRMYTIIKTLSVDQKFDSFLECCQF